MNHLHRLALRLAFLCTLLLTCVLFVGAAFASSAPSTTVELVDEARIQYTQIPGLVIKQNLSANGKLHLVIDDEQTDWSSVLAYSGGQENISLSYKVTKPSADATKCRYITGNAWRTDQEIAQNLQNGWLSDEANYASGTTIGEYIPSLDTVVPVMMTGNNFIHAVAWYDESGTLLRMEKMSLKFEHTTGKRQNAAAAKVLKADIDPNYGNLPNTSFQVEDGVVSYHTPSGSQSVVTRVKAPAGATDCWIYYGPSGIDRQIIDGYIQLFNIVQTGVSHNSYGIEWKQNGVVLGCQALDVCITNDAESAPAPSYIEGCTPVPANRMKLTLFEDGGNVGASYQNNIIHYSKLGKFIHYDLSRAWASIEVKAPAGAKFYKQFTNSGSAFLGKRSWLESNINNSLQWMPPQPVEDGVAYLGTSLFEPAMRNNNPIQLFLPTIPSEYGHGSSTIIYWYAVSDGEPIKKEWYGETSDSFALTSSGRSVPSENALPATVTVPTFIDPDGNDWTIEATYLPQTGDNTLTLELHLLDAQKKMIQPGRTLVVYLPYPDGQSYTNNLTYTLRHYDAALDTYNTLTLTPMPQGLRFETDDFSPFAQIWDSAAAPSAPSTPPKTGDDSQPALWMSALALALLTTGWLIVSSRKRRKA